VAPAGPRDAIAGVPARYVAAPASTDEAAAVLRAAAAHGLAVVVRGGGGRQDWAAPPRRLDLVLDTGRLTGVVEHAAGDLIAVVRAGTPVADLQATLSAAGQQLALDVPAGASVGGAVAVNASGPRRLAYGTVRDLLIGVTVVRADGVVARAGGKVVKNVAGYDIGKLVAGSYGTLALVTECAFRLHPLPAAAAYVSRVVRDAADAGRLLAAVRGAQAVPSALEVAAGPGDGVRVTVLLEGTARGVAGRTEEVCRLLGDGATGSGTTGSGTTGSDVTVSGEPPAGWSAYPWRAGEVGLKLTGTLSRVPSLLTAARAAADRRGAALTVRGSAGVGVLYAGLPADERAAPMVADLRAAAAAANGHAVVLTAPPAVRARVDPWGPVPGLGLMRRVKERFDPDARLAPGRFVGGI
jgi:glycolate oxidase FAD binding subunit